MTEVTVTFKMILSDKWDEPTCKVVGQIAIAFAQLEHILWLGPKRIDKLDLSVWDAMAGVVPIPERCRQIREAYALRHMNQNREAELEWLLKRVVRVNNLRNSVIHGRWGIKKKDGVVISRHRIWKNRDRGIDLPPLRKLRDEVMGIFILYILKRF